MIWYGHTENIATLAEWLVVEEGYRAQQLLTFLRSPWKWQAEWNQLCAVRDGNLGRCAGCDQWTATQVNREWRCCACVAKRESNGREIECISANTVAGGSSV